MHKSVFSTLVLLVLVFVMAACTNVPPTAQPQVSPLKPVDIPVNGSQASASPLASPTVAATEAPAQPGTGILRAQLSRLDGTPMRGITIYAALIEIRGGTKLSAVDPVSDPKAETDANGNFVIRNLKPGQYALAAQSPVGIIMPHNEKGEVVIYDVKADAPTDLGQLKVGYTYPDS